MTKQNIQKEFMAAKYDFPYHYLPSSTANHWQIHRQLNWGFEYLAYLTEVIHLVESNSNGGTVLDIGCGDGRLVNEIAAHGIGPVTGVDIDERAIRFAEAFRQESTAKFHHTELSELAEKDFSVITAVEVIEHIPDDEMQTFVTDIHDHLAENGTLVVSVPTTNMPVTKEHYRHYDIELLKSQLSPHFKIIGHSYIHQNNIIGKIVKKLNSNRLYTMNSPLGRKILTGLYRRFSATAKPTTGSHLVAVATPKSIS